ncbi:hypothetical protein, partial [Thermodesulfatator autotrophicus]|uniref:hypothetical protein n=1 Tax=Thermodesulfatator autotrophicus TaxID=1795632 RepID=UPI0012FBD731
MSLNLDPLASKNFFLNDFNNIEKNSFSCSWVNTFNFTPEEKIFLAQVPHIIPLEKIWQEVFEDIFKTLGIKIHSVSSTVSA